MSALPDTMAAALDWRDMRRAETAAALRCPRCADTGTAWWCGKPGEGGRKGPCPRCQREGSKRFVRDLARETFG